MLKEIVKKIPAVSSIFVKLKNAKYSFATLISPRWNTQMRYKSAFGKKLDLNNPQTLNEKVLWLKLNTYYKNPLVIQCADKFAVRQYVTDCGCEEILIPLIGAWEEPEQIPWDELPESFVLKWNFGAGMNIVCTDKSQLDREKTIKQLKKWGKCKYWLPHSEMQYKYIPRKIVCEELLRNEEVGEQ